MKDFLLKVSKSQCVSLETCLHVIPVKTYEGFVLSTFTQLIVRCAAVNVKRGRGGWVDFEKNPITVFKPPTRRRPLIDTRQGMVFTQPCLPAEISKINSVRRSRRTTRSISRRGPRRLFTSLRPTATTTKKFNARSRNYHIIVVYGVTGQRNPCEMTSDN